jgi:DNA repair exonuclease SbcCD ATPase subunit
MKNPILVVAEKWRGWSKVQRGMVVVLAVAFCALVVGRRQSRTIAPNNTAISAYPSVGVEPQHAQAPVPPEESTAIDENERKQLQVAGTLKKEAIDEDDQMEGARATRGSLNDPLIAHTAELAVATKEFSRSRTSLEEIMERHRAYAAKLRMVGQKSGSVLNATLRVPSTELTETVSELKSLGDVEREEQAADEITQQRADLEARLANARKTLKRLQELLQKQTYPDGNVRELQRQIASASAEVARLEAERQASEHRVIFANVFFTLREEIAKPSESLGAQLRAAAATGFGDAMASLAGLLAFLIGRGPVVVLWCAILYIPARFVWKKWTPVAQPSAAVPGN